MKIFQPGDRIRIKQIHGYPTLHGRTGFVLGVRHRFDFMSIYNVRLEDNDKLVYLRDDQMEKL